MHNDLYRVEQMEIHTSLREFKVKCIDVPGFLKCCMSCPNYKNIWSCPPFSFDPMDLWNRYGSVRLIARILIPAGCTGGQLLEKMKREKHEFLDELISLEKKTPGSLALSCGCCDLCTECAKQKGKMCMHPDLMRYSIESLGGNVSYIAEHYFNKPLLWMKEDILPEYMMLIGGLLI